MIQLKYFYPSQNEMTVNLGVDVNPYSGINAGIVNFRHGLKWSYKNKEVEIYEKGVTVYGYPSIDFEKILVVFANSAVYQTPANAAIFNLDGGIFKILSTPILIGKLAAYSKSSIKGICFGGLHPGWRINSKGEKVLALSVMHPESPLNVGYGDCYEIRQIDPESGEFGEVLSEGML